MPVFFHLNLISQWEERPEAGMERVGLGCLAMETGESSDILLSFWGPQKEGQQDFRELWWDIIYIFTRLQHSLQLHTASEAAPCLVKGKACGQPVREGCLPGAG